MNNIVYRIDDLNRVVSVNDAWDDFAQRNGGAALSGRQLYGRNIYEFIGDDVVQQVYAAVIERARQGRNVRFRYRCDSPERRREFDMEVRASSPREVEFSSMLVGETKRPAIPLFETTNKGAGPWLKVCSWCHAVFGPANEWQPLERAIQEVWMSNPSCVTHGICGPCAEAMFVQVKR